jgi:hypothetical protein
MKSTKTKNKCSQIRAWFYKAISSRFGPDADWLQNHIGNCPRCQRRIVSSSKVNLAISLMKSQRHRLDLLMCANAQAIGVLKHCLRQEPKARKLKKTLPEPKLLERCSKYGHSIANVAACIAILILMKIGVFSSMDNFHTQGQKAYQQYYAKQVGEDLASEIFS